MPSTQQKQIEIRRLYDYGSQEAPALKGQTCLLISCPYDEEIVDEIKSIPWQLREWTGQAWVLIEADPNQKPEDETNLALIRRIAKECADRRGWFLADETAESVETIAEKKEQAEAELLEQHVAAVVAVIPKLPSHSLRVTRWGKTISLQLARYLGDEQTPLFTDLFQACAHAYKNRALVSFDRKMSFGFVFEVADDPRIVKALMQCRGIEYLKVFDLAPVQIFADQTAHLVDADGTAFIGIDHSKVDMSELDFDAKAWQVALVGDAIYWVAKRDEYIAEWLDQNSHSVAGFGGAFGIFIQQRSKLPELLELFHLEEWFREWAIAKIQSNEVQRTKSSGNGWTAFSWEHPADALLTHLHKFQGSSYGGGVLQALIGCESLADRRAEIQALKEQAAQASRAAARANAGEICKNHLRRKCKSKAEFAAFAQKHGIEIKKSWSIDRILEAVVADQKLCLQTIGLEAADEVAN